MGHPMASGMEPVSWFLCNASSCSSTAVRIVSGIVPVRLLPFNRLHPVHPPPRQPVRMGLAMRRLGALSISSGSAITPGSGEAQVGEEVEGRTACPDARHPALHCTCWRSERTTKSSSRSSRRMCHPQPQLQCTGRCSWGSVPSIGCWRSPCTRTRGSQSDSVRARTTLGALMRRLRDSDAGRRVAAAEGAYSCSRLVMKPTDCGMVPVM